MQAALAIIIYHNEGTQKYELEQSLQPDEQMWIDVILGGGFRTVAGPLLFPTGAQRFPRPLYYVLLVYLYFILYY